MMKLLLIFSLVCWSFLYVSASEDVRLNSSLSEARVAYEGQRIIFTCVTRNTLILRWRSHQYIGAGDSRLQLYSFGSEVYVRSSVGSNTFATRNRTYNDNGVTVIESELHIIASLQHETATIVCDNNGHGVSKNLTFRTVASEDVRLNSSLNEARVAYEGQRIIFTCVTRNTLILRWRSHQYIGAGDSRLQLYSFGSEVYVPSSVDSNTFATRNRTYNDNGVTVIESELHLIASLQHETATIVCENNGHGKSKNFTFQTVAMPPDNVTLGASLTVLLNGAMVAYDGQRVVFTCMTKNALILQWRSDQYIGTGHSRLQLYSSGTSDIQNSNINQHTYAMRLNTTSDNNPRVIVSELYLTASMQYPIAIIMCANNGHGQNRSITFQTIRRPQPSSATTLSPDTVMSKEEAKTLQIGGSTAASVGTYVTIAVGIFSTIIIERITSKDYGTKKGGHWRKLLLSAVVLLPCHKLMKIYGPKRPVS